MKKPLALALAALSIGAPSAMAEGRKAAEDSAFGACIARANGGKAGDPAALEGRCRSEAKALSQRLNDRQMDILAGLVAGRTAAQITDAQAVEGVTFEEIRDVYDVTTEVTSASEEDQPLLDPELLNPYEEQHSVDPPP